MAERPTTKRMCNLDDPYGSIGFDCMFARQKRQPQESKEEWNCITKSGVER